MNNRYYSSGKRENDCVSITQVTNLEGGMSEPEAHTTLPEILCSASF